MKKIGFSRSFVFRYAVTLTALLVALEMIVFGFLYWSTFAVYERGIDAAIEADADALRNQFVGLAVTEMAVIITRRCTDEPGEFDEYLLATRSYEFIAGNIREWPKGIGGTSGLIDVVLDGVKDREPEFHRVRAVTLTSGEHLLVGRNLTELERIRGLIWKALLRTVGLSVLLGFGGSYALSRGLSARLDNINRGSIAILEGDTGCRMPLSGRGDEFDVLSANLNDMLDRIKTLMRSMQEVTDNIAHDMRKPISRLRSRIEVTLMGARDADAYRQALERTVEEAEDIIAVFNALLTIAMAESGAPRERFEEIDLAAIARSTVEIYGPAAEETGLHVVVDATEPVPLTGDRHLIAQALANLLDNAIKHAPGTGKVSILVRDEPDGPRLVIADSGPGIPAEFRDRAVERFTRMEQSRTTSGSGLGLSLVRAVARLHAASLTLDDNDPGLKVTLNFPATRMRS